MTSAPERFNIIVHVIIVVVDLLHLNRENVMWTNIWQEVKNYINIWLIFLSKSSSSFTTTSLRSWFDEQLVTNPVRLASVRVDDELVPVVPISANQFIYNQYILSNLQLQINYSYCHLHHHNHEINQQIGADHISFIFLWSAQLIIIV